MAHGRGGDPSGGGGDDERALRIRAENTAEMCNTCVQERRGTASARPRQTCCAASQATTRSRLGEKNPAEKKRGKGQIVAGHPISIKPSASSARRRAQARTSLLSPVSPPSSGVHHGRRCSRNSQQRLLEEPRGGGGTGENTPVTGEPTGPHAGRKTESKCTDG